MRSPWPLPLLLVLFILISSLGIVYARYEARIQFIALQKLQQDKQQATDEWGQLQLEQAATGTLEQILRRATNELQMHIPTQIQSMLLPPTPPQ